MSIEYNELLLPGSKFSAIDGATKKKILACIFSEELVLEKGKHATPIFMEPIQSINNISRVLGDSKKKERDPK